MIDSYEFGEIVVDGQKHSSDILILQDGSVNSWWRREGHVLNAEDLKEVLDEGLEVLVVGTGASGLMSVPQATHNHVSSLGIELIVDNTESACSKYNGLLGDTKVAAALHLTC